MASQFLTDITSTILSKTLDAAAARQKTISNNIANVETPGYKRRFVSFEDELKEILDRPSGHGVRAGIGNLTPVCQTDEASPGRPDGNNVNIDAEIADLAKNSLQYKAAAILLEGKGAMLRSAIMGGK